MIGLHLLVEQPSEVVRSVRATVKKLQKCSLFAALRK